MKERRGSVFFSLIFEVQQIVSIWKQSTLFYLCTIGFLYLSSMCFPKMELYLQKLISMSFYMMFVIIGILVWSLSFAIGEYKSEKIAKNKHSSVIRVLVYVVFLTPKLLPVLVLILMAERDMPFVPLLLSVIGILLLIEGGSYLIEKIGNSTLKPINIYEEKYRRK